MNKLVIAVLAGAFLVGCGSDGRNGSNGLNGQDGSQGQGQDGTNGVDGSSGADGADGLNGSDGANGANGGSCHVEQVTRKCARIFCDDGSEAYIGKCRREHEDNED